MFGLRRRFAPRIHSIGTERANECALLHVPAFAHPWKEGEFERLLSDSSVVADGAIDNNNNRLIGYVLSRVTLDEAEILTIVVDLGVRRIGIGQQLLNSQIPKLAARGVKDLFLEVDQSNVPARKLYGSLKFYKVGERKGYYRLPDGTHANALIKKKDLR